MHAVIVRETAAVDVTATMMAHLSSVAVDVTLSTVVVDVDTFTINVERHRYCSQVHACRAIHAIILLVLFKTLYFWRLY